MNFRYNKAEENILTNFNLLIKGKERIAIVGETGSGKTTITRLISRLYEFQKGKILIDDQDIREVNLESYRQNIGVVLQDPYLFSESIRYNLTYGNQSISDDEIHSILAELGITFIESLPQGLDTIVGERGSRLSMGQRQILSIVRAIIRNPKILILDEATSNVDQQSEIKIQKALETLIKGRTSIIIAHRLSTIKNVDRIIVLAKGKIIEEGSFNDLLERKGEFYEMYKLLID